MIAQIQYHTMYILQLQDIIQRNGLSLITHKLYDERVRCHNTIIQQIGGSRQCNFLFGKLIYRLP